MKRALIAISVSVGLACAASPALAQDLATITQNASDSTVLIEQFANMGNNMVTVTQGQEYAGEGWGGSEVQVRQMQVGESMVWVDQMGPGALARVEQAGGGYLQANISQFSQGGGLTAEIMQTGNFNRAEISQFGYNMYGMITQGPSASNNTATIMQRGYY